MKINRCFVAMLIGVSLMASNAQAQDVDLSQVLERLERLEKENQELREKYDALAAKVGVEAPTEMVAEAPKSELEGAQELLSLIHI